MTPSYVAFSNTERLIGDATKDPLILPDTFVFTVFSTLNVSTVVNSVMPRSNRTSSTSPSRLGIGTGMGNPRRLQVWVRDGYGCGYDGMVPVTRLAGYLYLSG
jgi:hypothetical protein